MKRVFSLMLVIAICLTLSACNNANNQAEIAAAICKGEWVSTNHIKVAFEEAYFLDNEWEWHYTKLIFFENGACECTWERYKDGVLFQTGTSPKTWKIENGTIFVASANADSEYDYDYYEYSNDELIGRAWYRDGFTYTHIYN